MPKLDREKAISLAVFLILVLAAIIVPAASLKARSDAWQDLADDQDMLARLEAAHQNAAPKQIALKEMGSAPDKAFLNAPTSGLAGAQFEAYLLRLALAQQASVVSSGIQQTSRPDDPEIIRIQAILDIRYDALQTLLYQIETGTPYVFVDTLTLQPPNSSQHPGRFNHESHFESSGALAFESAMKHQSEILA